MSARSINPRPLPKLIARLAVRSAALRRPLPARLTLHKLYCDRQFFRRTWTTLLVAGALLACVAGTSAATNNGALWRPRFATPAITALDSVASRTFGLEVRASSSASGWSITLSNDLRSWSCTLLSASYSTINRGTEPGWQLKAVIPSDISPEMFTAAVSCNEVTAVQTMAVSVVPMFAADFYILHMADEQIVQEFHNAPSGQWYTTVGTAEELAWEREPINLINPRFVIATGDQIDYNGALDKYNNWGNWYGLYGAPYNYSPSGTRYFSQQETSDIEAKLAQLYFKYHKFAVPYVSCPGNHDVPPVDKYLDAPAPPYVYWHSIGAAFYETNWGQRSWSLRMGDFYVLMHDWSESSLKTWATSDYNAATADSTVKYRLVGQHYNTDQAFVPSSCELMLVGHGHTTATLQSTPYYIYEDGPAFSYGTCGFFNFKRKTGGWTCDQTAAARNTSKDVWQLYTDNGAVKKVRSNRSDSMNVTATSITITNDLPENFYDGRVRFVLTKGNYAANNGTVLSQYDAANGTKTAVLVKVNIPASGTITVSLSATNATPPPSRLLDPNAFGSRMRISLAAYDRAESLNNFPALVTFNPGSAGFSYNQFASASGGDLRFADASGTNALYHEIDEWNTTGTSRVWVQVPSLDPDTTFFWAYWGNPLATNSPAWATNGSVWSPAHALAWHLKDYSDSTLAHPASSTSAPTLPTPAFIGNGASFGGSAFLDAGPVDLGSAFTLSVWVNLPTTTTNIQTLWANKNAGWNSDGLALFVNSYNTADRSIRIETGNGTNGSSAYTAAGAITFGEWHLVTAVVDASSTPRSARIYVDGIDRTASSSVYSAFNSLNEVQLGQMLNNSSRLKGTMDEARIENLVRSSNWVWASYVTVASNATFSVSDPLVHEIPLLTVTGTGFAQLFSWPATAVGYSLCSATNLAPPVNWQPVAAAPYLVSNQWQIAVYPGSTPACYYRLIGN